MNCLLEFCKITFTIYFIFTFLAGIMFKPLFTTFYPCFLLSFSKKITFFMLSTWYCTWCLMHLFLLITLFSHPLQLCAHLNSLPHSIHGTLWFMNFSLLKIILNIFHVNSLFGFCKMTFTIHLIFTFLAGIIFRPLFTAF